MFAPNHPSRARARTPGLRRGMTLVEALLVVAVIAGLMAILLPVMRMVLGNMRMVASQSNMRQVGQDMAGYSADNRGYILPSQFDYSAQTAKPMVRSPSPASANPNVGALYVGSWTDILWTRNKLGPLPVEYDAGDMPPNPAWDYRFDSPDYWAYRGMEDISKDICRSTVTMTKVMDEASPDNLPTPFGTGAGTREKGQPGYFAANDFFDSTDGDWYTTDMIRRPVQSIYLVDSRAGETIATTEEAWLPDGVDCEVDFRYIGDVTLFLFLDAHVDVESKWLDLDDLEASRQLRVRNLIQN